MKVREIFYILLFSFISYKVKTQTNLVSNPGFENQITCPNFGGQINNCANWNNVNLIYGVFTVGTPDYFHTCGSGTVVPPNTFAGQCNPHSGNAMTALVMYNSPYPGYREYMATPLSCPMTPGNTYTVSFWLTNGINPISRYTIKNIGVHFSNLPLSQSGYSLINVVPQLELTTHIGSTSWVKYTFTINPTSSWQHMTIGAFRSDSQNSPISTYSITTGAPSVYANYFFDDIEVLGSSSGIISTTSSVTNVNCNGASDGSATVIATGSGSYNYLWTPGNFTSSSVNNLSAGNYMVGITDGSCVSTTVSINITQPPVLVSVLSQNYFGTCENPALYLLMNNSGGTPNYIVNWSDGTVNSTSIAVNSSITSIYSYTVTDSNNCVVTQTVTVEPDQVSFKNENIPNVFTPNSDGVNDRFDFRIFDKCNDFNFEIFNRWGLSLFKSSGSDQYFWDGRTASGESVPDGTYFYILNINNGEKLKGTITIFR